MTRKIGERVVIKHPDYVELEGMVVGINKNAGLTERGKEFEEEEINKARVVASRGAHYLQYPVPNNMKYDTYDIKAEGMPVFSLEGQYLEDVENTSEAECYKNHQESHGQPKDSFIGGAFYCSKCKKLRPIQMMTRKPSADDDYELDDDIVYGVTTQHYNY